jgi:prophage regulatory protein
MEEYLRWKKAEEEQLLRIKGVLKIVPVSNSTWWSWCSRGIAPAPIKLSERTTCWRLSDIMAFIDRAQKNGGVE